MARPSVSTGTLRPAGVVSPELSHEERLAKFTGGLAPDPEMVPPFEGSDRLRPDGRPRPEFRAELRRIPDLANAGHVAFTLALPFGYTALATAATGWPRVVAVPVWFVVFVAMGSWFQRVLTLHHEAAHRLLFSSRRWNDWIGEKLIGWLVFGDGGSGYRLVHTQHHRDEFGEKEPDFLLYARYPVPKASLRRKLVRDAVGVSDEEVGHSRRSLEGTLTGDDQFQRSIVVAKETVDGQRRTDINTDRPLFKVFKIQCQITV